MRNQGRKRRADVQEKAVGIQRRTNSTCGVHIQKRSEETRKNEQQKRGSVIEEQCRRREEDQPEEVQIQVKALVKHN